MDTSHYVSSHLARSTRFDSVLSGPLGMSGPCRPTSTRITPPPPAADFVVVVVRGGTGTLSRGNYPHTIPPTLTMTSNITTYHYSASSAPYAPGSVRSSSHPFTHRPTPPAPGSPLRDEPR